MYLLLGFQEESLHNQAELLVRINDLTKLVKQVLSSTGTVPSPSTWPLRTLEDFKTVDELIKDPKNFAAEVTYIDLIYTQNYNQIKNLILLASYVFSSKH